MKLQQRRLARLSMWRASVMVCLATGLGAIATLPNSQIKGRERLILEGRELVSASKIHRALDFTYPQFIWKVNGIELAHKIESIPSIEAVRVRKQIIPPSIIITVREKTPVALATSQGRVGFLNQRGEWIDRQFYDSIDADFSLPQLKVINYQREFAPAWRQLYRLILLHPDLKVTEIHWQNLGEIYLQTKIGRVLLGSESSRLPEQFKTISKLKNLSNRIKNNEIDYIDLSNPGANLIQRY